jgi:hypothetical protein
MFIFYRGKSRYDARMVVCWSIQRDKRSSLNFGIFGTLPNICGRQELNLATTLFNFHLITCNLKQSLSLKLNIPPYTKRPRKLSSSPPHPTRHVVSRRPLQPSARMFASSVFAPRTAFPNTKMPMHLVLDSPIESHFAGHQQCAERLNLPNSAVQAIPGSDYRDILWNVVDGHHYESFISRGHFVWVCNATTKSTLNAQPSCFDCAPSLWRSWTFIVCPMSW